MYRMRELHHSEDPVSSTTLDQQARRPVKQQRKQWLSAAYFILASGRAMALIESIAISNIEGYATSTKADTTYEGVSSSIKQC